MYQRRTAFCHPFFKYEEVKPVEIQRRMDVQYGDACLSLQQVYEWTRKFMNGISSVTDSPRPGQAHRVVTPEGIAAVEAIVKENRRVTVNEIAAHLDMSNGSAHHIVHDKKKKRNYLSFSFDSPSYLPTCLPSRIVGDYQSAMRNIPEQRRSPWLKLYPKTYKKGGENTCYLYECLVLTRQTSPRNMPQVTQQGEKRYSSSHFHLDVR